MLAISTANELFDADALAFERFLAVTNLSAIVFRIIGGLGRAGKATAAGILVLRELASARIKEIAAQRALNDATFAIVKRAAANEAQFLRTGTLF